ncbi:rod shape-determining protein RodA [Carboxylicivirga sp. M1479]|uniref:rod shape-determining protein RodA n=1 Tax=Carboxylicivirga sp. M1479 TaxID=2594476 RepID=UPI00117827C9|nr:rod shape-determining protein RodA [Carboxylicivirga sp. M1479]TRX63994.1 rod shape-determining protein RodA [Carboxylicivirga sp. M1479]
MASRNYNKNIDWITVGLYSLLVLFGWLNIYAANFNPENPIFFDTSKEYFKQLVWIGFSLFFVGMILITDSKFYVEFAYIFYGITILLLIVVLLFGKEINGAKSWFELGPVRFQPAELSKMATNLAVARALSRYGFSFGKFSDLIKAGAIVLFPMLLILLQNDTGSALVYSVFIIVFYREGLTGYILTFGFIAAIVATLTLMVPNATIIGLIVICVLGIMYFKGARTELIKGIIAGAVLLVVSYAAYRYAKLSLELEYVLLPAVLLTSGYLLYTTLAKRINKFIPTYLLIMWSAIVLTVSADYFFEDVLSHYQRTRINVLLGIEKDPLGAGYNVNQSKIAIGSGGLTGKGYLQGTQTKFNFVPEQSTDFIYCTVGEEWGFMGSTAVVVIFLALLLRLLYLAELQHSAFSRIYGYGVAAIFFFHFAINIGMTIGLAPVIGIPLPFFSYGGSSLWGFTLLLFVFLKLDTNRNELIR